MSHELSVEDYVLFTRAALAFVRRSVTGKITQEGSDGRQTVYAAEPRNRSISRANIDMYCLLKPKIGNDMSVDHLCQVTGLPTLPGLRCLDADPGIKARACFFRGAT